MLFELCAQLYKKSIKSVNLARVCFCSEVHLRLLSFFPELHSHNPNMVTYFTLLLLHIFYSDKVVSSEEARVAVPPTKKKKIGWKNNPYYTNKTTQILQNASLRFFWSQQQHQQEKLQRENSSLLPPLIPLSFNRPPNRVVGLNGGKSCERTQCFHHAIIGSCNKSCLLFSGSVCKSVWINKMMSLMGRLIKRLTTHPLIDKTNLKWPENMVNVCVFLVSN